jgi:tetratricopeptide (TPR) repeat protein
LSVVLFGLGLASKPMLVTMPFTLLLFDYWALERFEKWNVATLLPLVKEKLPYFILSALSIAATLFAQGTSGAIQTMERFDLADRVSNALTAYVKYAAMLFYPADLAVWYPFERGISIGWLTGSAIVLAAITAACIWQLRSRKYLFVGWLWFIGTLVPVIGIVQVGRQSMADRYTYIPYIGLAIAVVWLVADVIERAKIDRRIASAATVIVIALFGILTFRQVSYWQNSETLFQHTLAVTDKNFFIEHNYCYYLQENDRLAEAESYCKAAIEHDPQLADAYNTLGSIKLKQKNFFEARVNFEKAVEVKPAYPQAYANLALAANAGNDFAAAADYLNKGVEVDDQKFFDAQRLGELYSAVGNGAMQQKAYPVAVSAYEKAAAAQPNNSELRRSLAVALNQAGRKNEAVEILEAVVRGGSGSAELHNSLGLIYAESNRIEEAQAQFRRALQINPNFAPAQNNLRRAMGQ